MPKTSWNDDSFIRNYGYQKKEQEKPKAKEVRPSNPTFQNPVQPKEESVAPTMQNRTPYAYAYPQQAAAQQAYDYSAYYQQYYAQQAQAAGMTTQEYIKQYYAQNPQYAQYYE